MKASIQLIVGLANPGNEYQPTRHNAGAWFVEELAHAAHIQLRPNKQCHGIHAVASLNNAAQQSQRCHLLIPSTFMNHSGQAVRACLDYYHLSPESILIAHDDLDLPIGTVKLKWSGGDGGHNGLKDIIRHLNTKDFYRLRIGIGRPTHGGDIADYVLKAPSKSQRLHIDQALATAHEIIPLVLSAKMAQAMQALHTQEKTDGP